MLAPETILQNRYRVVCQLGQGGMGTVYEAIDKRLDTTIALKETFFTDERLLKQFEREARLLARLHHPALPRVSDHFTEGDGQFLVMQFISGEDLLDMLQRQGGPFPFKDVLRWADQLLDALDYLHTQEPSIIHRDIKPQNLKLTARGQIILLDFGLAKGFAGPMSRVSASSSIFGYTPNYAPLEQIQGMGTDPRSDLYSLAATLYHLMTGVTPPDVLTRLTATTDGQPDPLRSAHKVNHQVPDGIAGVLNKALAIGRNQRPATAAEMRGALLDASRSHMLTDSNEAKAESLPPTIVNPALQPGTQGQEGEPAPQIVSESHYPTTPQEPGVTVASPTVVAPTSPPTAPPTEPALFPAVTRPLMPSVQPTPKSNRLSWIIGGFVALLVVGILIAFMTSRDALNEYSSPSSSKLTGSDTIKVGVYMDLSGQTSSFGQSSVNGIKMAADEINKAGGVGGRRVELIVEDDQGRPDQAATVVTKLINQDKVQAVLGEVASSNSLAAAPKAQAAKVPMITPSSTNPKVTQVGDYIFRVCFIDPFQGEVMAKFAANTLKAKRAAILIDVQSDYSRGLAQFFEENFTKLGGQIIEKQSYTQTDRGFKGQLTSIRSANPDVIFVPGYYGQVGVIAKQAKELGIRTPLLGGDGWDAPQLFQLGGTALNGSYMANHYAVDDPAPATQKFVTEYKRRYNTVPDAIGALAYDAMKMLADAITRAGTTESPKLRDAIAQTKNFVGVTGSITINSERNAVKPAVVFELQNGRYIYRETIQP